MQVQQIPGTKTPLIRYSFAYQTIKHWEVYMMQIDTAK